MFESFGAHAVASEKHFSVYIQYIKGIFVRLATASASFIEDSVAIVIPLFTIVIISGISCEFLILIIIQSN